MKRSSFLKSLLGIAVAPKVLAEVDLPVNNIVPITQSNASGVLTVNQRYISAIQFLDTRAINPDIWCKFNNTYYSKAFSEKAKKLNKLRNEIIINTDSR